MERFKDGDYSENFKKALSLALSFSEKRAGMKWRPDVEAGTRTEGHSQHGNSSDKEVSPMQHVDLLQSQGLQSRTQGKDLDSVGVEHGISSDASGEKKQRCQVISGPPTPNSGGEGRDNRVSPPTHVATKSQDSGVSQHLPEELGDWEEGEFVEEQAIVDVVPSPDCVDSSAFKESADAGSSHTHRADVVQGTSSIQIVDGSAPCNQLPQGQDEVLVDSHNSVCEDCGDFGSLLYV